RAPGRALWNNAQRNRLRPRQMRGSLSKINLTGRAHAFDVSPVGREVQVGFKNFGLRVMPLQFERAKDLNELSAEGAGAQMITQPSQLHRDGRGSVVCVARSQVQSRAQ